MKISNLQQMLGGWFVGDFDPSVIKSKDFEVAVKLYKKGDYENEHFHKIATEITVIMDGEVLMSGNKYKSGDIIVINPNESTDFKALSDVKTVVVKFPSVINDKYII
jgi:quercetin dioxygenase-like cupin family protein|tara:strand:- start:56 stop:376 length:321 start_codon:yes stop_codon:yes gene_type:complete